MYPVPAYTLAAGLQHSSDLSALAEEAQHHTEAADPAQHPLPAAGEPLLQHWRPAGKKPSNVVAPRPAPCLPNYDDERKAA